MSTALPSLSDRPFVTIGTAVRPFEPVDVVVPVPSRRNHASIVNVEAPSPGAGPSATYALLPPRSIAPLPGRAADPITVIRSLLESRLSLPVSISTYDPAVSNVAVVCGAFAFANVTVPGPLTLLHVVTSVPEGSPSSTADAARSTGTDGSATRSGPASTAGGRFGTPGWTWTAMES